MINIIGAYVIVLLAFGIYKSKLTCLDIENTFTKYGAISRGLLAFWLLGIACYSAELNSAFKNSFLCFIFFYIPLGFLTLIHEAGHFFLVWANTFFHFAGGSLFQWFVPMGVALRFYFKNLFISTWVFTGIFGISLLKSAPYIADARAEKLILLGGGEHDWKYMLGSLGLLQQDQNLAFLFSIMGWIIIIPASVMLLVDRRLPSKS